jgi:hypothetical protein
MQGSGSVSGEEAQRESDREYAMAIDSGIVQVPTSLHCCFWYPNCGIFWKGKERKKGKLL